MRKNNKLTNKILILSIIIFSMLGITCRVLAAQSHFYFDNGLPEYGDAIGVSPSPPPWVDVAGSTILSAGTSGVITEKGGNSKDAGEPHDTGSTAVGVDGGSGGGNSGASGAWNGSIDFDLNTEIKTNGGSYQPNTMITSEGGKQVIWFEDLCNFKEVLCTAHGYPLTGQSEYVHFDKADGTYWAHDVDPSISPRSPKSYDWNEVLQQVKSIASGDVNSADYKQYYRTPCEYTGVSKTANAAEAFVLSEYDRITGNSEKTPLQIAWWYIHGQSEANELGTAAMNFQKYIEGAQKGGETTVTSTSGESHSDGFKIKYEPEFVKTEKNYNIYFDENTQKYIMGPFKLKYYQVDSFAFMNKLEIFVNDSKDVYEYISLDDKAEDLAKKKFKLAYGKNTTELKEENRLPDSEEEFYIILNYDENVLEVTNIKATFQYMNASGNYTLYTGTFKRVFVQGHIYGECDPEHFIALRNAFQNIVNEVSVFKRVVCFQNEYIIKLNDVNDFISIITKYIQSISDSSWSLSQFDNVNVVSQEYIKVGDYGDSESYYEDIDVPVNTTEDGSKIVRMIITYYNKIKDYVDDYEYAVSQRNYYQNLANNTADADTDPNSDTDTVVDKEDYQASADAWQNTLDAMDENEYNAFKKIVDAKNSGNITVQEDPAEHKVEIPSALEWIIWKDLEYIPLDSEIAQSQSIAGSASRWWQEATVEWRLYSECQGKIKIKKEFDGIAKNGDIFTFKVKVDGQEEETLKIVYKEGAENAVESKVYTWESKEKQEEEEAPNYTVTEIDIPKEYELEEIVNSSGKLEDGKTIQVMAKNKVKKEHSGDLKIIKEVDDTNLDTNQYSLVGQKFKFDVTIYGPCEFTYAGQTYKLGSKEDSQTITAEVTAVSKNDTEDNKNNSAWELADVKWYSDQTPTWEIKESTDGQPEGSEEVKLSASKGVFVDGESKVIAENKHTTKHGKINVIKTLEGESHFSEEELDDFIYYFKVKVYKDSSKNELLKSPSGEEYNEVILGAEREAGTNKWTAETNNDYIWAYGNDPYFEIEELDRCPKDHEEGSCKKGECKYWGTTTFDEAKTKELNEGKVEQLVVTDNKVSGTLKEEATGVFDCNFANKTNTDEPKKGNLKITKEIQAETEDSSKELNYLQTLRNLTYNFIVKVSGTFEYQNLQFRDQTIQLYIDETGNTKFIEILDNESTEETNDSNTLYDYDDTKFITIKVENGNTEKTWESEEFTWYGEAPTYEVYEYTAGNDTVTTDDGLQHEIIVSGVPRKGNLSEKGFKDPNNKNDGYNTVDVKAINKITDGPRSHSGQIRLIKTLEGSDKLSPEYIDSLEFKFNIKIYKNINEREPMYTIPVELGTGTNKAKYIEEENTWYWEYISPKYSWNDGEDPLCYEVEEVSINLNGIELKNITGENKSEDGTIAKGTLKDSGEATKVDEKNPEGTIEYTIRERIKELLNIELKKEDSQYTYVVAENKLGDEPKKGKLQIKKELTQSGILTEEEFEFTVKIKGNFSYDGENNFIKEFTFGNKEDNKIIIRPGETWESPTIYWYGEAPTYEVVEKENDKTTLISKQNDIGTIKENSTVTAVFINQPDGGPGPEYGRLKISKVLDGGAEGSENTEYQFKVTIKEHNGDISNFVVKVKAGETWESPRYTWKKGEKAPEYEVQEINIPETSQFVEMNIRKEKDKDKILEENSSGSISGSLLEDDNIIVTATNIEKPQKGRFEVSKKVISNKLVEDLIQGQAFDIIVRIKGKNITVPAGFNEVGDYLYERKISLTNGTSFGVDLEWRGEEAPIVTVEEEIPGSMTNLGWDMPQYSNNGDTGIKLQAGTTVSTTITNKVNVQIDLTMELGGIVWEDVPEDPTEKNTDKSTENGIMDGQEKGIDGVEVYVYTNGALATAHKDSYNSEITYPIITSGGGKWKVTGLPVGKKYDVEFVYDGQTYEATNFTANGYNSNPDAYSKYSLAVDYDREEVNNRIQEIYGNTQIDGNGNTVGKINGTMGEQNVFYESTETSDTRNKDRIQSILQTTDENEIAFPIFKAKARTSSAGINLFPLKTNYSLTYTDATITLDGLTQKYEVIYKHCLHINLGLKYRKKLDVEAVKDLYSAKLIVDGKSLDYKFNSLADIWNAENNGEYNKIEDYSAIDQVTYELGLYKTDYYYKAEMYKQSKLYDGVKEFIKNISGETKTLEDTELKLYLTYKISIYNNSSPIYKVKINKLDDYAESSLGEPISVATSELIEDDSGNLTLQKVADVSYKTEGDKYSVTPEDSEGTVTWTTIERKIKGSDGETYNKLTADGLDITLNSGESKNIFVTYSLQKETIQDIEKTIPLGNKSNIVEIADYATYYQDGRFAGKIDGDSAPSNVNVREYNDEKLYYEDDSDTAPRLNIKLLDENREISGIAWEDDKENPVTAVGNGIKDEKEAVIGGLTTELIEKIRVNDEEYDFLWPTSENLDFLGGRTLEDLTGFASVTETARGNPEEGLQVGQYKFTGIPTGEYVVRFLYGNDKTELEDQTKVTLEPATAYNIDGKELNRLANPKEGQNPIRSYTANYDKDRIGASQAVYNGQDYKSTIYQAGENKNTFKNEYHNLKATGENVNVDSDARDSEARRLEVIANSQTITNENSSVLRTANDKSGSHQELYKDYSMYADTAKVDLSVENLEASGVEKEVVNGTLYKNAVTNVEVSETTYKVKDINFGLIERPENNLILDKEIKEIKLTTNDGKMIFDAIYNIKYHTVTGVTDNDIVIGKLPDDDNYLVAKAELDQESSKGIDQLQAIDKNERNLENEDSQTGTKNFRFINVDSEILQGTTIELTYQISAFNLGETDYTSKELEELNTMKQEITADSLDPRDSKAVKAKINEFAKEIREEHAKVKTEEVDNTVGRYLGETYYTGNVGANDTIATTKVRQIIDYVDNDAVFTDSYNTEANHMWRNTSINELLGNGYDKERILSANIIPEYEILDEKGISYKTEQRNNLILSTDDQTIQEATAEGETPEQIVNSNAGFERKLSPITTENIRALVRGESEEEEWHSIESKIQNQQFKSDIILTVTKTVSAQDDADNLAYDNLTEIVKFENSVGRRDETTVVGNANPKDEDIFNTSIKERDASATELITFTPPTGINAQSQLKIQVLIITVGALALVVLGIVVIKKKVLK